MKKIIFVVILALGLGGAAIVSSQVGWIGTDWVTSGSIIQSQPLKANLDYLYENKVDKPTDCTGESRRLTWSAGVWVCQENGPDTTPTEAVNNCTFNGVTVRDGSSVSAYETDSVGYGETCSQQVRTCTNGTLSGSFTNSSCTVGDASTCSFGGVTVAHGQKVTAYQASTVESPNSCVSENRVCTDGVLSGEYIYAECEVQNGCRFDEDNYFEQEDEPCSLFDDQGNCDDSQTYVYAKWDGEFVLDGDDVQSVEYRGFVYSGGESKEERDNTFIGSNGQLQGLSVTRYEICQTAQ